MITNYNKYCKSHYDASYQIEIVSFESEDQLLTKFSTELMAGKGPDLIFLSMPLSFEKLIESGAFADVNEINAQADPNDKIDFNEYNAVVMDSGIFNGKRLFVPLYYSPDVVITTKEILSKYNIPSDFQFTYNTLKKDFSDYLNKSKIPFIGDNIGDSLFYYFLDNYADFNKKTTDFTSVQFSSQLEIMEQIILTSTSQKEIFYNLANEDCMFISPSILLGSSVSNMARQYAYIRSQNKTPLVHVGLRKNKDDVPAFIQCGIAVNANSNKKEKALAFIKYALSERIQEYWCGALGDSGKIDFGGATTLSLPVNLKAYQSALTAAADVVYSDGEEPIGLDNQFMRDYLDIIQNINSCSLYNYYDINNTYYNKKVIGSIVEQYLDGNMTKEKFIRDITSATKLYYYE